MPFDHLQHTQNQNASSGSAVTIAYGSNVAAGSLLILTVSTYGTAITVAVTDSQGNTWVQAGTYSYSGSVGMSIWYVASAKAGATTVTVTPNATMLSSLGIMEFSGPIPSPLDATSKGNLSSTVVYAGPVGITAQGDLVVACFSQSSANLASTVPDGGYSLIVNVTQGRIGGNPSAGSAAAFKISSFTTSDYGTNFYLDQSVNAAWAMASFKTAPIKPATTKGLALIGKVQPDDTRLRRFCDITQSSLDSLMRRGQLVQISPSEWEIVT